MFKPLEFYYVFVNDKLYYEYFLASNANIVRQFISSRINDLSIMMQNDWDFLTKEQLTEEKQEQIKAMDFKTYMILN